MPSLDYDSIHNADWKSWAQLAGKTTTVVAVGIGVIGFFLGEFFPGLYALSIAAFIAIWELPWIYHCFGPCVRLTDIFNHKFYFRKAWTRFVVHVGLGIFLCWTSNLQIATGICMEITALFYLGAALTSDTDLDVPDGPPQGLLSPTAPFGTF